LIFVSSISYNGNLGGLSGADQKCQTLATQAGLSGTFKAWLSSSTTSASTRITHASVPYIRFDGVIIANDWTDLTDGKLIVPINLTEYGTIASTSNVWTNTTASGGIASSTNTCSNWGATSGLGIRGQNSSTSGAWTYKGSTKCSSFLLLYCIQE
jgi:hypothetical protein